MRVAKLVRSMAAPLLVMVIVGCGSSKSTTPAAPKVSAGNASPTSSRPATSPTTTAKASSGKSSGSVDCAAVKSAVAGLIVNWQLVAQLPKEADVSKWPERVKLIGTLPEFGKQLDTLQAQLGSNADAKQAIEFMQAANAIVEKGLGGDATAPQQLAQYLGDDLTKTLTKQVPIGLAMSAAKCG
jgi:hypothetical protein